MPARPALIRVNPLPDGRHPAYRRAMRAPLILVLCLILVACGRP